MKWLVDLPLIAALVLPIVLPPHVETFTTDKRHGRRAASELGGGSPTSTCPFRFAEESFASSVRDSVHRLSLEHRPLLVHTRNDNGVDSLVFLREAVEDNNYTFSLDTPLYYNLKAISHLPVSVVAVLAPDLLRDNTLQPPSLTPNTLAALTNLLEVLEEARELVTEEIFPIPGQVERQMSVINKTEEFIRDVNVSGTVSHNDLEEFGGSLASELMANSHDAVSDYLQRLNRTITELLTNETISSEEFGNLSVVVKLPPFAEPNSFIVQYYEQLLDYQYQSQTEDPNRIVLSPFPLSNQHSNSTTTTAFSSTQLGHIITRTFSGSNKVFSSAHDLLSEAANEIICSPELTFPSCPQDGNENNHKETLPPGFTNPTERGYVALIIFIGAFCVVLVIIVVCIIREGKVMRIERRKDDPLLSHKPNKILQTGRVNDGGLSESDDEEAGEGQIVANRGVAMEENEDSLVTVATTRGRFYQNRQQSKRVRERSSLNRPSTGGGEHNRNRPSVTYSEVSIYQ